MFCDVHSVQFLAALAVLVSATFCEEIKIATFKGMAQFVPAVRGCTDIVYAA